MEQKIVTSNEIAPADNPDNSVNEVFLQRYKPLYKAVYFGDWKATNDFLKEHPEGVTARIDSLGNTALHIAASFGHLHIVEELVKLMSEQDLELKNNWGDIAFFKVIDTGIVKMAEYIIKKNINLVKTPNEFGLLPVTYAVLIGQLEIARYLYSVTPLEELLPEKGCHGATLLTECFHCTNLDLALHLLLRCPSLALTKNNQGDNLGLILATKPSVFSSGCQLLFWQRWIYNWIQIEPASAMKDIRINITKSNASDDKINKRPSLLHQWIQYIFNLIGMLTLNLKNFIGVERIYQAKITHVLSLELLRLTCDQIATLVTESQLKEATVFESTIKAAKNGISEIIIGVINANPRLLYTWDSSGGTIFSNAVRFRQAKVFSLIYGIGSKSTFASYRDYSGNIMLHMAGVLELSTQLNRISGAALQMQRELQWFEEVKHITPLGKLESLNKGMTARELFTENHKDLRKDGERWMKSTATSCTVVAALIVTVMFAASFTVPGGNNQNTGYPMFQDHNLFKLFIISDAISLFSSTTSLLMFLGILTSRYAEDDFLKSLPTKLIIGLSMLFISIATMMITFYAAISIMLPGRIWISIPVILFASVPVSLFVWLQFPLLVEIYNSTYGPSIFNRNMKPWIGVTHKIGHSC